MEGDAIYQIINGSSNTYGFREFNITDWQYYLQNWHPSILDLTCSYYLSDLGTS